MLDFLLEHGSYLGIILFLILTGCGLPIPEEVPIIAAGWLSSIGELNPWLAFGSCLIGAILGDAVMYGIGYHWGHGLLKDHPKFAHLLRADREERYEEMIRNHGLKVLFVARFMVGVRSPVYFASGVLRVPFRRFLLMDLLCATTVVGLFFSLSYVFGEHVAGLIRRSQVSLTAVVLIALTLVLAALLWRRRNRLIRLHRATERRKQGADERARRTREHDHKVVSSNLREGRSDV